MSIKEIASKINQIIHVCVFLLISSLPAYADLKFNDVEYRMGTSEKLNLEVIFKDITLSNNKKSSQFIIGFGGIGKLNEISQMNLSEYENDFRLPKNVRGVQKGRFYINDWSVENGLFGRLLGALSEEDREKVIGACSYLNDKKIIDEIVKNLAKSYVMQQDFLERQSIINEIKHLTQLCVDYIPTKEITPYEVGFKFYNDRGISGFIKFKSLINDDMGMRRIAFDAEFSNKTKTFHAFRIDKSSLTKNLPVNISHKGQIGNFFISDGAHNQNRLRKLYNYVSESDRYFLKSMCKYFTDDQVLNDVLLKLSQATDDKLAKRFLEKNSLDKHKNKLRNIATSCIKELERDYTPTKEIIPLEVDVKVYNDRWVHGRITFKSLINDDMLIRRIAFDADLLNKTKTFHAFRIDKSSLKTSLPEKISHKGQTGNFYIADRPYERKRLRKLYNYVSDSDRYFLKSMCKYFTDDQVLNDVLLKLSQVTDDKLAKRFLEKNSLDKHKNKLKNIATSCTDELNKIPVVEVQFALKENGYSPGPLDGRWGKKTNEAISNYLRDNEINWQGQIPPEILKKLLVNIYKSKNVIPDSSSHQYFDDKGTLKVGGVGVTKFQLDKGLVISLPNLRDKLAKRKTINVFRAWNPHLGLSKYGLVWTGTPRYSSSTITLSEVFWPYYKPKYAQLYKGIDKFISSKQWKQQRAEYSKRNVVKIIHPDYPNFLANIAKQRVGVTASDGVLLDWWHDDLEGMGSYRRELVAEARKKIIKSVRKKLGPDKIIMGNVNWRKDSQTIKSLNGVYLELNKKPSRLYTRNELLKIESLLFYYQQELASPKIIALDGWRKTKSVTNKDRNTKENRRMAKVLTAMSIVIPKNGYILYADNNRDTPDGDHAHLYYDFYSFDIGKPVDGGIKIANGVGLKEHKKGFVAYNITQRDFQWKRKNGISITIPSYSGLFCKEVGKRKCLPLD